MSDSDAEMKSTCTTGVVAALCGVMPSTVRSWADRGLIRSHRIPGTARLLFLRSDVDSFMIQNELPLVGPLRHSRSSDDVQGALLVALEKAVDAYGKPGGPWNVPDEPGEWLDMAKQAIKKAKGGGE